MRSLRGALALILAPCFVILLTAIYVILTQQRVPGQLAMGLVVAYIFATPPSALLLYFHRRLSLTKLGHYTVSGFLTGVVCTVAFLLVGYSALLDEPTAWLTKALAYLPLIPIGALTGAFVWVVADMPIEGWDDDVR